MEAAAVAGVEDGPAVVLEVVEVEDGLVVVLGVVIAAVLLKSLSSKEEVEVSEEAAAAVDGPAVVLVRFPVK